MRGSRDVLARARANRRIVDADGVAGELTLTADWLSFRAHALDIKTEPLDIAVAEIATVRKYRTIGFIPNGLSVTMTSGDEYRFALCGRDRFADAIAARIPG